MTCKIIKKGYKIYKMQRGKVKLVAEATSKSEAKRFKKRFKTIYNCST